MVALFFLTRTNAPPLFSIATPILTEFEREKERSVLIVEMSERGPVIYGVEHQGRGYTARALTARSGETEKIQFLCGTLGLRHDNQIHLLDYNDDSGVLDKTTFPHPPGEVWDIASCPGDSNLLTTVFSGVSNDGIQGGVGVWKMEEEEDEEGEGDSGKLHEVCLLPHDGVTKCSVWCPSFSSSHQLATLDDKTATVWTLDQSSANVQHKVPLDHKGRSHNYCSTCWNPHHNQTQLLLSCDSFLHCWDFRSQQMAFSMDSPHGLCVRGIDFNPNRPHIFVSCGDDCRTRFWDARKLTTPLLSRQDHSHWVWSVQYNLFHDQLLLTASSDSQVILSRLPSIASEPLRHIELEDGEEEDEGPPTPMRDEVIRTYEEHEDSVYKAVWSSADAWVLASLSYDGRLVINHVPTQEKFAILTS